MIHLTARCEIFALGKNALVVVDVVLPAVLGLVHVRVPGVDTYNSCLSATQH